MASNIDMFFFFMLFIPLLRTTISTEQKETDQTKPDPYFEEWKLNAWKRPSQCHVCRLLVTELYSALNQTNRKDILYTGYHMDDKDNEKKTIVYEKSEIRLMESMENLCNTIKSYVSRARRKFPYVKGAKSHFREGLDNLVKNSKVKLNIDAPPDMVDDNTKEIIRLKFKCVQMLEEYEDDITEWYTNHRKENLMDWLCKLRALKHHDQECLNESDELFSPEDNTITSVKMNNNEGDEQLSEIELDQPHGEGKELHESDLEGEELDESDLHLEL